MPLASRTRRGRLHSLRRGIRRHKVKLILISKEQVVIGWVLERSQFSQNRLYHLLRKRVMLQKTLQGEPLAELQELIYHPTAINSHAKSRTSVLISKKTMKLFLQKLQNLKSPLLATLNKISKPHQISTSVRCRSSLASKLSSRWSISLSTP